MLQLLLKKKKKNMPQGQTHNFSPTSPNDFSIERSFRMAARRNPDKRNKASLGPFPISLISRLASWPIYKLN